MKKCKLSTKTKIEILQINEINKFLNDCGNCYFNIYCDGYRKLHEREEKILKAV